MILRYCDAIMWNPWLCQITWWFGLIVLWFGGT